MKKMLPVAMLAACALTSFTSFSAAKNTKTPIVNSVVVSPLRLPLNGTYGAYTYSVLGTSHISFYLNGTFVASYNFIQNFPSQVWVASINGSIPGLMVAYLYLTGTPPQYNLDLVQD
jgi:hypothetical protein